MVLVAASFLFVSKADAACEAACIQPYSPDVSTTWSGDANAPTRIIMASPSHNYGGPLWIAIEMHVAPGWFVYADAASGQGPVLEWKGSLNLAPPVSAWRAPLNITDKGKTVSAYAGSVVLPISIAPIMPEHDIRLSLSITYAVCGEVCRPAYAKHDIIIKAAPVPVPAAAVRQADTIARALPED